MIDHESDDAFLEREPQIRRRLIFSFTLWILSLTTSLIAYVATHHDIRMAILMCPSLLGMFGTIHYANAMQRLRKIKAIRSIPKSPSQLDLPLPKAHP